MAKVNVAVLRGGPSDEYDVSLETGAAVLKYLDEDRYRPRDVLIDKEGVWHTHGTATTPERALSGIDVVFIAMHGEYGEGGEVQELLDAHAIPYTGSGVVSARVAMDKGTTRSHLSPIKGIKMPTHVVIHADEDPDMQSVSQDIFSQFGPPYIVKPLRGGSSLGVTVAHSANELPEKLQKGLDTYGSLIVEQFITGKEGTCGVVENLRNEQTYALPPIEIRAKKEGGFWDYESKYDDSTEEICPGNFTDEEKDVLQRAAREVHEQLGLSHYSRSDFIIAPSGIYFLEVNTLPGLTPTSLLPKAVDAVGVSFSGFIDHLLQLALRK